MPRIRLKPNSAEFWDVKSQPKGHACEMPGCASAGEHKAPKDRGLNDYYHFCVDHVREYNKAWNFFSGMSDDEVQDHMESSLYGDRPTWRYDVEGAAADMLRRAAWKTYNFTDKEPPREKQSYHHPNTDNSSPEIEAMAIMGLAPPLDLSSIKTRYKELAKKYHPDLNRGCPQSEEMLKQVNMAYTILKLAYEKFEKLPERSAR